MFSRPDQRPRSAFLSSQVRRHIQASLSRPTCLNPACHRIFAPDFSLFCIRMQRLPECARTRSAAAFASGARPDLPAKLALEKIRPLRKMCVKYAQASIEVEYAWGSDASSRTRRWRPWLAPGSLPPWLRLLRRLSQPQLAREWPRPLAGREEGSRSHLRRPRAQALSFMPASLTRPAPARAGLPPSPTTAGH